MSARVIGNLLACARPQGRRACNPVRRHSRSREDAQRYWRPLNPREIGPQLPAAEHFDRRERQPGQRNGPLGHIGIEVLRELYRIVCYRSGRLEPSIDYLMRRIRRSRAAVVRALAALKRHGFLD